MNTFYTDEKSVQMLIFLMKAHGVKKIIASPGTTNISFVASVQQDSYFEIYSVADERSAAYMACGLAAESGEAVALTCTGATASRNYIPALTEAYYRKLPILAITSTQFIGRVGQLHPQVIDRSVIQNDIAVKSVHIPVIRSEEDAWDCNIKLNSALLALWHHGGGPVHINLTTEYSRNFNVKELPAFRVINRVTQDDAMPSIPDGRIGIFIGAHNRFPTEMIRDMDAFCEKYNAIVFCDHTSNYTGKYSVLFNLISVQSGCTDFRKVDLLIDLGNMSGAYMALLPKTVWRVNPDGEIRDTWKKITKIFEMDEHFFFLHYLQEGGANKGTALYRQYRELYNSIYANVPEVPFSNIWVAYHSAKRLPTDSVLHLGILNSLRSWNFFEVDKHITCYCNTGGFGIDGVVSSFIGSSLANREKIHYLVVGDLAFFYDLNAIASGNVGRNLRIILINNGCGTEFKMFNHPASQFGADADKFIAAKGHYGRKSETLVKNYAENLGFQYFSASTKEAFQNVSNSFFATEKADAPMLLEVFTADANESTALELIHSILPEPMSTKKIVKDVARKMVGEEGLEKIKKLVRGEQR